MSTGAGSHKNLEIRRLQSWADAAVHRDAWNALVTASAGGALAVPSVFQTFEWNQSWWTAFGESNDLVLLGAFDGNGDAAVLVGVAPLMVSLKTFPFSSKVLSLIGGCNFASDYCAFLSAPGRDDVLEAFGAWIEEHPELWNEMDLINMVSDSPDLAMLSRRFGKGVMRANLHFLYDAPTRILGVEAEDKEVVSKKSLKRHFNWFMNQGELSFGHQDSVTEIKPMLDGFFAQHIGRRSVTDTPSQFTDERQREFYRILVDQFSPLGWLRFFTVALEGTPIAYHFGFEFAGKFYWYKPAFDIQYIKKSPGEVLLKTLFEYAIKRKLGEFDFTAGSEAFKYRFSNRVRKLYRFRAFRSWPQFLCFEVNRMAHELLGRVLAPFRKKPAAVTSE